MKKNMNQAKFPHAVLVSSPQQTHGIPRPGPVAAAEPTYEEIAGRAYQIYVEKGCPKGQSEQNWLQAEQEQRNRGPAILPSK